MWFLLKPPLSCLFHWWVPMNFLTKVQMYCFVTNDLFPSYFLQVTEICQTDCFTEIYFYLKISIIFKFLRTDSSLWSCVQFVIRILATPQRTSVLTKPQDWTYRIKGNLLSHCVSYFLWTLLRNIIQLFEIFEIQMMLYINLKKYFNI